MTASLPQEVRDAFDRFITCEYTTVDASGQPITWPVTPYYEDGAATIDVTTGLGYPKKADDAARHPSVSLLFSDPTGSGLERPASVLVQGIAEVDERDLDANRERYWRESAEKLPATKDMHPPKPLRAMVGWYYTRIYIRVRPERVFSWPGGEFTSAPEVHDSHIEEVRSGHSEEPREPHPGPRAGEPVWDRRIDELGERYESAVVSWLAPDGFPLSARLPVNPDRDAGLIRIETEPGGLPLEPGPACVVAHRHAEDFTWQRNFQVRGDLVRDDDGWALAPRKLVGGFEIPEGRLAVMRENFRKAIRFRRIAKQRLKQRS
jgi:hypothetical protein